MRFLAIDLELEQPNTNHQTPDSKISEEHIIQVGIVVFELAKDNPVILHSETIFLNYPYPLSSFIKTLTSITDEQVNTATRSPYSALGRIAILRSEYETSRQIVEWGSGDLLTLREHSGVSLENLVKRYGFARSTINVKNLFQCYALANNIKKQGGLSKSMSKVGVDFKNTVFQNQNKGAHWAETDALNTARIFNKLIDLLKKEESK